MKKHLSILFIFAFCFFATLHAQTDTVINGKHYQIIDDKKSAAGDSTAGLKAKKHLPPLDSIFVIENKKMKYYNNWITAGAGIQQNLTYKRPYGFAGGLDYNFHIKRHYFQLGTVITGERFGSYDNYQFHFGYGKRFEGRAVNAAVFAGVSYSTGFAKDSTNIYERPFRQPGLYAEGQIIKKIAYDVGAGLSIFADFNREQTIIGSRLIVYFSGAYKGKQNTQYRGK